MTMDKPAKAQKAKAVSFATQNLQANAQCAFASRQNKNETNWKTTNKKNEFQKRTQSKKLENNQYKNYICFVKAKQMKKTVKFHFVKLKAQSAKQMKRNS